MLGRRELLSAAGAGLSLAMTRAAVGQEISHAPSREGPFPRGLPSPNWVRYPEPNVRALDPRFNKYMVGNTYIERLWTGAMWAEGPVWFGDVGMLIFSAYEHHVTEVRQRFAAHVSGPFWIEQATDDARRGCAREP